MAKSGTITLVTGQATDPVVVAALNSTPPIMTLGSVAVAALAGSNDPLVLKIDLVNRKVEVAEGAKAGDASAAVEAILATEKVAVLTQDDDSKRVSSWSDTVGGASTNALVTPVKPTLSLAGILAALENYHLMSPTFPGNIIYVDQVLGKVTLIDSSNDIIMPLDVELDQTVATAAGTIKNAFE